MELQKGLSMIWVTTSVIKVHRYINALDSVSFLRNFHRHTFHIKAYVEIHHNDRELEFFMVKEEVIKAASYIPDQSNWSCETMADFIFSKLIVRHPSRYMIIEVSEDNENGIIKHYPNTDNGERV